ncbi:tail-specific protease, partial [Filimonas sp.]
MMALGHIDYTRKCIGFGNFGRRDAGLQKRHYHWLYLFREGYRTTCIAFRKFLSGGSISASLRFHQLTLQKFYRINGGSTQMKGVVPDIKLPDLYELMDVGERKDSNSLAWDQIA